MFDLSPRKCLKCGKSIVGRSDKKFCDAYCRNSYNNNGKSLEELNIKRINSTVRKNRRILKSLSPRGKAIVRKEVLVNLGYNFNYFSSIFKSKNSTYYLCYDYGFRALQDNAKPKVQIIQWQDYMLKFDPWQQQ
jgi:hypothetical protein